MRSRLAAAIDPEICWHKFAMETGSKLIGESAEIFVHAVKLGGDPDVVGLSAADFTMGTIMLRAQRRVTASTFGWLTIVMHGAIAMLMIFILEIVANFVKLLQTATEQLAATGGSSAATPIPTFNMPNVEFYRLSTVAMVLLFCVINAYAINATDGGHKLKLSLNLSIMLFLSGAALVFIPPLVAGVI